MYSGTTLRNKSGHMIGAHQKIDRVARRHLRTLAPDLAFPDIKQILHFEGLNGPDGIKRKSPGKDEPWHFIDPQKPLDGGLLDTIDDHLINLTKALQRRDHVRAAFEAAWLAHAMTDGLTPAHHYPYEEKLESLRGEGKETRNSFKSKVVMPGTTNRMKIKNNWDFWGTKGVMTTHFLFEIGVSTTIASRGLKIAKPSGNELIRIKREGVREYFLESLRHIDHLQMYQVFQRTGWTRPLARQTANELIPTIIRTITLAWYYAAMKAEGKIS